VHRVVVLATLWACGHPPRVPHTVEPLTIGPLTIELVVSARAARFHAIDQLSAWYPFHHAAYAALATGLTPAEKAALDDHRALRTTHPWGRGLEAAYYLDHREALAADLLAREDAVQGALDARVAPFVAAMQPHVAHFAAQVPGVLASHASLFAELARLFGTASRSVPVVLVPRPGGGVGGGGANGGVIVVEVTTDELSLTPLVHELVHVLLAPSRTQIANAAARCGLDAMTLEEGIVHAVAPGLVHDGPGDPLAAGTTGATARFYALGLVVRPALQRALVSGDVDAFLVDVCAPAPPR
jgi:hypothetical protein